MLAYSAYRSSHWRCSVTKGVLRNFEKFTGKHMCQSLFFNKVGGSSLQLYLKKDPGTGALVRILRNFLEDLFYRTPPGDCF